MKLLQLFKKLLTRRNIVEEDKLLAQKLVDLLLDKNLPALELMERIDLLMNQYEQDLRPRKASPDFENYLKIAKASFNVGFHPLEINIEQRMIANGTENNFPFSDRLKIIARMKEMEPERMIEFFTGIVARSNYPSIYLAAIANF